MFPIESLLSARQYFCPKWNHDKIYMISNLSGRLSLYVMKDTGSIPQPLLPPQIALQNPDLVPGVSYQVYPKLEKILVMIDQDGDENYQPMFIPIEGGYPEPIFSEIFDHHRVHCCWTDVEHNLACFIAESRQESLSTTYLVNLETKTYTKLGQSTWGLWCEDVSSDHRKVVLSEGYTVGDNALYLWDQEREGKEVLFGKPLTAREHDEQVPLYAMHSAHFVKNGILLLTSHFQDTYTPALLSMGEEKELKEVQVRGTQHQGQGELVKLSYIKENRYLLEFNIDGVSWVYEAVYQPNQLLLQVESTLVGKAPLDNGVLESIYYDPQGDRYICAFSSATSPLQIYAITGSKREEVRRVTNEVLLGIKEEYLSPGEDASFHSHDGLRISARLYLPSEQLGYHGPYPLVYYIHGGPQSQERPNFAWFSMPLIQYLTLNGFAVFVPNVRGSTGYGLSYTKKVDRDWGGQDRLDHVHAMKVLANDPRIDTQRAAVVGRSYGGYMTLTLASRHPELWSAAVDMFGPYNLITFMDRIPETWKPYFQLAVGHPEKDHDLLLERSPSTYMEAIQCPLLVIQGQNDPRVIEQESRDVVEQLRSIGKEVEYLLFADEGHDILKWNNKVKCYEAITQFFIQHLKTKQNS